MTRNTEATYLLALARNVTRAQLLELQSCLGELSALLDLSDEEMQRLPMPAGILQRVIEARRGCDTAADMAAMRERGIHLLAITEPGYPELLADCSDAPVMLFCRGRLEILEGEGIAVVGSRKCSERALRHAWNFGVELGECGLPVVSGLALGVDGQSHEGALSVHGPTVAVLGCGVDVCYPPRHHELFNRLAHEGLLVSEYPPGTEPHRTHFPQRNRIISGLSRGTLVIEAPMGSGALITARIAADQGREIFAMPGPALSPYVAGNHHLIKSGHAKLTETLDDILVEFGTNRSALMEQAARSRRRTGAIVEPAQVPDGDREVPAAAASGALEPDEQRVLELLSYEGTHINEVVRRLGMNTAQCSSLLTMLEIRGLISSASGGYYVRL
ncbi:MAG: DNA-protecting protein DprA [Planctomycetales bacterium]|nr:DNA-processing protein DprA [bacterium]UNM09238.1 MAG: DNA-protecting protein DprA [Planctomycetales bacterium]